MPIVGASIIPHFPALLSSIGGSRTELLKTTLSSIQTISDSTQQQHPDAIVVIAPHSNAAQYQGFVTEQITTDLKSLGDITHQTTYYSNYLPLFQLKKRIPKDIQLVSQSTIGYEFSVPLLLISEHMTTPLPEVTAIHTSQTRTPVDHVAFGSELREVLETSNKRYAVIASCDFARYAAPVPNAQEIAAACDKIMLQSIRTNNFENMLHPTENMEYLASWVCGVQPLSVLIGILGGSNYSTTILSYDHSLDLGLLVATVALA